MKGAPRGWKLNSTKGSSIPVSNVPIWGEVLQFLDDTFQEIKWVQVTFHVNVMGNEQANTLANRGRVNNPLYDVKGTPHGRQHHTCTSTRTTKKPRLSKLETSPIKPLALNFEGVTCPDENQAPPRWAPPSPPPTYLSDLGL